MDESLVTMLDAALTAILDCDDIDQARGIAHAALHREEYHGHELETRVLPEPPEWDDREAIRDDYGLVMPFLMVESKGGPFHDMSFVAGFQCGEIDGKLEPKRIATTTFLVYASLLEQVDLIAMRHGYVSKTLNEDEEWAQIGVTRV